MRERGGKNEREGGRNERGGGERGGAKMRGGRNEREGGGAKMRERGLYWKEREREEGRISILGITRVSVSTESTVLYLYM